MCEAANSRTRRFLATLCTQSPHLHIVYYRLIVEWENEALLAQQLEGSVQRSRSSARFVGKLLGGMFVSILQSEKQVSAGKTRCRLDSPVCPKVSLCPLRSHWVSCLFKVDCSSTCLCCSDEAPMGCRLVVRGHIDTSHSILAVAILLDFTSLPANFSMCCGVRNAILNRVFANACSHATSLVE